MGVDAGPTPDAGGCPAGRMACGAECVDVRSDERHCGACDAPCEVEMECVGGACAEPCAEGQTRCGAECVDTSSDAAHCGGCGAACEGDLVCEGAECVEACVPTDPPTEVCDGVDNDCDREVDPGCAEGLLAWYRFESEEGAVADASGNGLNGTALGGARRDVDGRQGGGLYLDGAEGSRVEIADAPAVAFGSALTAEAWIFPVDCSHGSSGHNTVVAKEGEILLAFQNSCRVANYASNGAFTGDFPDVLIAPGRWTHLAMTYDGSIIRSYVNGNPVGEGTAMAGAVPDTASTLYIGARTECCNQTFHGRIDEVKLWTVVRSAQEICEDAGGTWVATTERCTT